MDNDWDLEAAMETYRISRWGNGYFRINDQGEMTAHPLQNGIGISIPRLIEQVARENGIHAPFLLRFQDILRHQVATLNQAFHRAIEETGYEGNYRGVFPIKVNQLREVVEEILDAGKPYHYGLEVGSKPELIIALALHEDPESFLVCNGYKDQAYIDMALAGRRFGKKVILVVEKREELRLILERAGATAAPAQIGIRLRLNTKGSGKWAMSGGEGAKFGLTTPELVEAAQHLIETGQQDALKLIHFHVGSQISDINQCTQAVREGVRCYAKLRKMGFMIESIDVGGGVGVDYDGSRTASDNSMNYTLDEFAQMVVQNIQNVCDEESVPHPQIMSESGRAIVAHHSLLVVEAFGRIEKASGDLDSAPENADRLVHQLHELACDLTSDTRRATLHKAQLLKEEASTRFGLGLLSLEDKAAVEAGFWKLARRIAGMFDAEDTTIPEVIALREQLSEMFVCNFSVFQSLIDYWAVGQLFPIAPLDRLLEAPSHPASLVDITCDSDGKIDRFIGEGTSEKSLPLHSPNGSPYRLGIFMMGAYQDVMGDIHNLFGSVAEVHVFLDEDETDGYYVEEIVPGHNIQDVLSDVQYEPRQLVRQLKAQVDAAIKADQIRPNEGMNIVRRYEEALRGTTYLSLNR
jgi:arginine decarboxylase